MSTSVHEILARVAERHGLSIGVLRSKCRDREAVRARREAVQVLSAAPYSLSSPVIAQALGGRHHTSILHLRKTGNPSWTRPAEVAPLAIQRSIVGDLRERLTEIARAKAGILTQLSDLEEIEAEVQGTLARIEQVGVVAEEGAA